MEAFLTSPKTTVYVMDGVLQGDGGHTWWGPPRTWSAGPPLYPNYPKSAKEAEERHGGGANVLFCDWHVKVVKPFEWKSNLVDTAAGNPLSQVGCHPTPPWGDKNDGSHPWFRTN